MQLRCHPPFRRPHHLLQVRPPPPTVRYVWRRRRLHQGQRQGRPLSANPPRSVGEPTLPELLLSRLSRSSFGSPASANNFLPVVDGRNQLVGMVALQDLKEYLGTADQLQGVIAYDIMRPPPPCVTPGQRLIEVLPVVLESEQRNIPVVSTLQENRLVGALARAEVLGIFSEVIAASRKGEG